MALGAGALLVVVAFLAGSRVADTREGLIFEVVALLSGLAGVMLLIYGWVSAVARTPAGPARAPDLLIGGAGLTIATALVAGIAISAGPLWAVLGLVLLLPMAIGAAYLCVRFLRAPIREWRIDLQRLTHRRG
jgi:hypothetical protein